jgi:hypothetical protein
MGKVSVLFIGLFTLFGFFFSESAIQTVDYSPIQKMIVSYKKDPRGPYESIKWFLPDGTIAPANQFSPKYG